MNKRERMMLIATVLIVGLGLGVAFMPEDILGSLGGGSGISGATAEEVERERENAGEIIDTLRNGRSIQQRYKAMAGESPVNPTGKQRPGESFSTELYDLLLQQGFQAPPLDFARSNAIEGVNDYYSVDIQVQVNNSLAKLITLLKTMEQRGMLIKELSVGRGRGEGDVRMEVTVARLVKHDAESRKRVSLRSRRS